LNPERTAAKNEREAKLTMIDPKLWTQDELRKHSVNMRQFIDFRQSTLPNGMRIIEAYNGSGLTFTILPDRGLDIWSAHYKGIPLTWLSQGSPFPPDFGQTWLQQFNGGLLTTCGLTHVGPPEKDEVTGEFRDLHGRYSRLRAGQVNVMLYDDGAAECVGEVSESALFADQLRLIRIYRLAVGSPQIEITDTVINMGDQPSPFMLLYHVNVGYPLVAQGARWHSPDAHTYPRDAAAIAGFDTWADYNAASAGYAEQVFFHHVKADAAHYSEAAIVQQAIGVSVKWHTRNLPYITQWKNTRQGIYVSGIEPANCLPEGRSAARKSGRLATLKPGEMQTFQCTIRVLDGAQAVADCTQRIAHLQNSGTPVAGCHLQDYANRS
jgi:hypothetical protein